MSFPPFSAFILFPAMVLLLELGRRLRIRKQIEAKNSAIETAIFALFGLLLAFTFSGAMLRYDAHRELIVQETNYIGTAYLRLDLLPAASQAPLRQLFRDYTTSRLRLYDTNSPDISPVTARLQQTIWREAIQAVSAPGANPDAAKLLLPALNHMIDITETRQNAFSMHPPSMVYLLLFILSCWCAFMAGFGMTGPHQNWVYILAFALVVTLTIYTTLDIEFPSQGLIRLSHMDRNLIHLRDSMK